MRYAQFVGMMTAMTLASTMAVAESPNNTTEYEARDNGGYHVNSKSDLTTQGGTVKTGDHTVDVKVDDDGRVTKNIKTESSQDAKGLMNEKNQTKEVEYKEKKDGGYVEKTITNQRNADGTNVKSEVKTDVEIRDDGSRETTTTRTKTTDPKGLMNKTTEKTKTVNGRVVD